MVVLLTLNFDHMARLWHSGGSVIEVEMYRRRLTNINYPHCRLMRLVHSWPPGSSWTMHVTYIYSPTN